MKDQIVAILEAVRLAQSDLRDYYRSGEKNPHETLARITVRSASKEFLEATSLLRSEAPSIVPEPEEQLGLKVDHG
jgi:hypothetical protein